ncbi:hypothetical protein TNCV_2742981 [Trichonephila clavipes]|nr:hypothetical protein TNCV_2742981 [Trichonephila clavipes]
MPKYVLCVSQALSSPWAPSQCGGGVAKFDDRGVIVNSMGTINPLSAWGRKPILVGENRYNSSRREDDEPDEGCPNYIRVLPNSTDKLRRVIVGSIGTINHNRIGANSDNRSRREYDVPDEEGGLKNAGIWSKMVRWTVLHEGAPAHFSITVRNYLHATYPGNGPVVCPPHSPGHHPLDILFWGHLKSLVYETPTATVRHG